METESSVEFVFGVQVELQLFFPLPIGCENMVTCQKRPASVDDRMMIVVVMSTPPQSNAIIGNTWRRQRRHPYHHSVRTKPKTGSEGLTASGAACAGRGG
jgi:hypothetical protein